MNKAITKVELLNILKDFKSIYNLTNKMHKDTNGKCDFSVDGRLFGDVGECIASYMFNLSINHSVSTAGYDAETIDNKKVEIKIRKVANIVVISKSSQELAKKENLFLIVFDLSQDLKSIELIYNGLLSDVSVNKSNTISKNRLKSLKSKYELKESHSIENINTLLQKA